MKKILLALAALLLLGTLSSRAQFRLGVATGLGFSGAIIRDAGGYVVPSSSGFALNLELNFAYDFHPTSWLTLEPQSGLGYGSRSYTYSPRGGYSLWDDYYSPSGERKFESHGLTLPVRFNLCMGTKVAAFIGNGVRAFFPLSSSEKVGLKTKNINVDARLALSSQLGIRFHPEHPIQVTFDVDYTPTTPFNFYIGIGLAAYL
jgi:hypothetical protein